MCKAYNSYLKDKLPIPAQSLKEALRLMITYLKRKLIPFFLSKFIALKYQYDYIYKYVF